MITTAFSLLRRHRLAAARGLAGARGAAAPGGPAAGAWVITAADTSVTRPLYWSVRRELWENRSIYIAPAAVAVVTLFGYLIATMGYALSTTDMAQRRAALPGAGSGPAPPLGAGR